MTEIEHHPIPIDEKLSHLNEEEQNQLFNSYHYSKTKVNELIKRFNLDHIHIAGLRYILKFKETKENSCPDHNIYLWETAKGRNKWGLPFCPVCNENAWTTLPFAYLERKRQAIIENPIKKNKPRVDEVILSLEKYQKLDFSMKVVIMCWDLLNQKKKTSYLSFRLFHRSKIFPTDRMSLAFMQKLEKNQLLHGNRLFVEKIFLEDKLWEFFKNGDYLIKSEPTSVFSFWQELAYQEVLEYLLYELNKKNITIHIDIEIEHVLQYMIAYLSVQQCMFATWAAIKDACSLIAERNWDIDYSFKVIPEQLKKKSDRIIEGSLKRFPFARTYHCRESKLADIFYNDIAKLGELGFTQCPTIDLLYSSNNEQTNQNNNVKEWGDSNWLDTNDESKT